MATPIPEGHKEVHKEPKDPQDCFRNKSNLQWKDHLKEHNSHNKN